MRERVEVAHDAVLGMVEVNHPERRLADLEPVQQHVPAAVELDEVRAHVCAVEREQPPRRHRRVRRAPVVEVFRRLHVLGRTGEPGFPAFHARRNRPRAGDGDVRHAVGVEERRVVVALDALPRRVDFRVVGGVVRERERRPVREVQVAVVAEADGPREPVTLRHDDAPAAGRLARPHGLRKGVRRLHALPRAEVGDREVACGEFGHRDVELSERRVGNRQQRGKQKRENHARVPFACCTVRCLSVRRVSKSAMWTAIGFMVSTL